MPRVRLHMSCFGFQALGLVSVAALAACLGHDAEQRFAFLQGSQGAPAFPGRAPACAAYDHYVTRATLAETLMRLSDEPASVPRIAAPWELVCEFELSSAEGHGDGQRGGHVEQDPHASGGSADHDDVVARREHLGVSCSCSSPVSIRCRDAWITDAVQPEHRQDNEAGGTMMKKKAAMS